MGRWERLITLPLSLESIQMLIITVSLISLSSLGLEMKENKFPNDLTAPITIADTCLKVNTLGESTSLFFHMY